MDARRDSEPAPEKLRTTVERTSDRELVVTRMFDAPARLVFKAWTTPDLFQQWWVPKSLGMSFVSFEADFRTGGTYRFVFRHPSSDQPMAFFGRFLEVTPPSRIVWTNEEAGENGSVTTVTLEDLGARTRLVLRDVYPSKDALDEAIASGSTGAFEETFDQLDDVVAALGPAAQRA